MSIQTNQYLMYALSISPKEFKNRGKQWNDEMSEKFSIDSAYDNKINHVDGIFWLYDGCNGDYSLIGYVFEKTDDDSPFLAEGRAMELPNLSSKEKKKIKDSVKRNFDIEGEFKFYLITHYR